MTVTPTVTRWPIPSALTVAAVEEWVSRVRDSFDGLQVHVGQHGVSGPGDAAAALQGALCLLHRAGIEVELSFPELTLSGERAQRAFSRERHTHVTKAEDTLAQTLFGLILGQLCSIDGSRDHWLGALQRSALSTSHGLFGTGVERSLCALAPTDNRLVLRPDVVTRQSQIRSHLRRLLKAQYVTLPRHASRDDWFHRLSNFATEATDNTFEHGRFDLDGQSLLGVRFMNVRRVTIEGAGGVPRQSIAPDPDSELARYLAAVRAILPLVADRPATQSMRFIMLTIADGGVGIAAQMAGSHSVFERPLSYEYGLVRTAMTRSGTSKPTGTPGRGAGLTKMLNACYLLNGFLQVRSGRLNLSRTFIHEHANGEPDFDNADSPAFNLAGEHTERPVLAGTAISLMFPLDGGHVMSPGYPLAHYRS